MSNNQNPLWDSIFLNLWVSLTASANGNYKLSNKMWKGRQEQDN